MLASLRPDFAERGLTQTCCSLLTKAFILLAECNVAVFADSPLLPVSRLR
jgi:hypothetical protein